MGIKQQKILLLIAACVCIAVETIAQSDNALKVYHYSGNVKVQKSGQVEDARRGIAINKACIIRLITPASRVMLIDSTGVYAVLDRQGAYSFDSVARMIRQLSKRGVSSKFFQYVWISFTEKHGHEEMPNNVMAGVFRGNLPMKAPADSSIVNGSNITFKWIKERLKLPYRFILRDAVSHKEIINKVLKEELEITVPVNATSFVPGHEYEWSVDENDAKHPHNIFYKFVLAKQEDMTAVKADYKLLSSMQFDAAEKKSINNDIFSKWVSYYGGK